MREKPCCVPPIDGAKTADDHLTAYVRRDLAWLAGVDRGLLAELDARPKGEWTENQRTWTRYSIAAVTAFTSWVANNAPDAIPALREAGLTMLDAPTGE